MRIYYKEMYGRFSGKKTYRNKEVTVFPASTVISGNLLNLLSLFSLARLNANIIGYANFSDKEICSNKGQWSKVSSYCLCSRNFRVTKGDSNKIKENSRTSLKSVKSFILSWFTTSRPKYCGAESRLIKPISFLRNVFE